MIRNFNLFKRVHLRLCLIYLHYDDLTLVTEIGIKQILFIPDEPFGSLYPN
jgi:hypothetical protein